jgi:hypothetical protein
VGQQLKSHAPIYIYIYDTCSLIARVRRGGLLNVRILFHIYLIPRISKTLIRIICFILFVTFLFVLFIFQTLQIVVVSIQCESRPPPSSFLLPAGFRQSPMPDPGLAAWLAVGCLARCAAGWLDAWLAAWLAVWLPGSLSGWPLLPPVAAVAAVTAALASAAAGCRRRCGLPPAPPAAAACRQRHRRRPAGHSRRRRMRQMGFATDSKPGFSFQKPLNLPRKVNIYRIDRSAIAST